MNKDIPKLIEDYRREYIRTTGKELFCCSYAHGWFRVGDTTKVRRAEFETMLATLKTRPTVADRMEMVNGVEMLVKAHEHVVVSFMPPHKQCIEDRDTPWACSVQSETYWSS